MSQIRGILATFAAGAFLFSLGAHAQDEQSLGDVARQSRLQKQQKNSEAVKDSVPAPASTDAPGKPTPKKDPSSKDSSPKAANAPKVKKVITNEEIPEHIGPTRTLPAKQTAAGYTPPPTYDGNPPAEYWKTQIQAQKNYLVSLQDQISELANSIQFAGGSCVQTASVERRAATETGTMESMKAQLEQQQKSLEEFQDAARKQGFGSSVYDP